MTFEKVKQLLERLANQLNLVNLGIGGETYCFWCNTLTTYYETFGLDAAKKIWPDM